MQIQLYHGGCHFNYNNINLDELILLLMTYFLSFNDALKIKVKLFGKHNLDVAKTLFHLGISQCEKGNFDDAMVAYEESYNIRKEILGNEHEEVAHIFSNMVRHLFYVYKLITETQLFIIN